MIEQDFAAFSDEVRRVATVLRLRASPTELVQITQAYFKAFHRRPLTAVIAGADRWIERGDRFPKPAQWIDAMPRAGATMFSALTPAEADDWLQAERQRWEGRPCGCVLCVSAGADDKPIRFVPDVESDGRDARGLIGENVITRGHWAHGDELVRWHNTKAEFYRCYLRVVPNRTFEKAKARRQSFEQRLETIFAKRPSTASRTVSAFTQITGATIPPIEREPGEEG